jgi:hypothetical protein
MVETSAVFLINVSASLVIGGKTRRIACGRMIRRIAFASYAGIWVTTVE